MFLKEEQGAAAVEFALILPLLLTILFGIVDFGLLLYNKAMLTNASREGARRAVIDAPRSTAGEVEQAINRYCQNFLITFSDTPFFDTDILDSDGNETVPANLTHGDYLTVKVQYRYDFFFVPNALLPEDLTIEAETVMRME